MTAESSEQLSPVPSADGPAAAPEVAARPARLSVVRDRDPFEGLRDEARKRAMVEVIGLPDDSLDVKGFAAVLRRETARYWDTYIEPMITEHWPEVRQTRFYAKFKIGAQKVYAPAPYTVVLLSRQRPYALRLLTWACRVLRLSKGAIVRGLQLFLPLYARLFMRTDNRRIVMMAAFIAAADEAFDNHLGHVAPEQRADLLRGILDGEVEPPTPSFKLIRALRVAMDQGTTARESLELARATEGCARWGEAETRRALRVHDSEGLCHRGEGIRNGIDGLAWTARRYISQSEWNWMYDVSLFIQMMDDWVDLATDLEEGVITPVAEGTWTLDTVREHFANTTRRVVEIAAENGEAYPPYLELIGDAYAFQVRDLLQNMVRGIAD